MRTRVLIAAVGAACLALTALAATGADAQPAPALTPHAAPASPQPVIDVCPKPAPGHATCMAMRVAKRTAPAGATPGAAPVPGSYDVSELVSAYKLPASGGAHPERRHRADRRDH